MPCVILNITGFTVFVRYYSCISYLLSSWVSIDYLQSNINENKHCLLFEPYTCTKINVPLILRLILLTTIFVNGYTNIYN